MKIVSLFFLTITLANLLHAGEESSFGDADAKAQLAAVERMSRSELNDEIERVEAVFYSRLNAHIDDKKQRVHCGYYRPTGSHIKRWSCEPRFVSDASSNAAREFFEGSLNMAAVGGSRLRSFSYSDRRALSDTIISAINKDEDLKSMHAYLEYLRSQ